MPHQIVVQSIAMCLVSPPFKQPAGASAPADGGGKGSSAPPGIGSAQLRQPAKKIALLLDVVRSQQWPSFEEMALSSPQVFHMIGKTIAEMEEFKGQKTLLHVVLHHSPPFKIVAKMIVMLLDPISVLRARDCRGRTPLHVAAACDADPMAIKLLGSADSTACTMLDEDSRTPLHLACNKWCNSSQDEDDANCGPQQRQRSAQTLNAVRALLSDSLEASLIEDKYGMTALECAIISEASLDVVELLQKATVESLKCQERLKSQKRRMANVTKCNGDSKRMRRQRMSIVSL